MRHNNRKHSLLPKNRGTRLVVRNLATSLLMFEKIRTTKNLSKAASMLVDKLITYARKSESFNAIRELNSHLFTEEASRKVMEVLLPRFQNRISGFTSRKKLGLRVGDGAEVYEVRILQDDVSK